ncbi:UNVERIFIED_CONTAM: hypothetical protein GTU68_045451 [Idotea baltica]|nr:hypothetical protein [Idotea baltica]
MRSAKPAWGLYQNLRI